MCAPILVGQVILPKLTRGVTQWDPPTDTVLESVTVLLVFGIGNCFVGIMGMCDVLKEAIESPTVVFLFCSDLCALILIGQAILPKLTRGVTEWEPRTDTVLIHTWIHPWLPLLGSHVAGEFQYLDRESGCGPVARRT